MNAATDLESVLAPITPPLKISNNNPNMNAVIIPEIWPFTSVKYINPINNKSGLIVRTENNSTKVNCAINKIKRYR